MMFELMRNNIDIIVFVCMSLSLIHKSMIEIHSINAKTGMSYWNVEQMNTILERNGNECRIKWEIRAHIEITRGMRNMKKNGNFLSASCTDSVFFLFPTTVTTTISAL